MRHLTTGFAPLLRTALRLNARLIAPWIVLLAVLPVSSFVAYDTVFASGVERRLLATTIGSNPAFNLLFGKPHDLLTADGFTAWRSLALGSFFAGLMTILVVVRETRAKEDSGEAELIASNAVGRHTPLAVALALAWLAALALGAVIGAATILVGGAVQSSLMLAAAFTASGMMFAAVAAVTSQVASFAGAARGLAVGLLGASFLARGYADSAPGLAWLGWATPLGWLQHIEPAGANDGRPLLLSLLLVVSFSLTAAAVAARRDFGQGVLPARRGAERGRSSGTVPGLVWRLQGGSSLVWAVTFALLGSVLGFLLSSLGDVLAGNAQIALLLAVAGRQGGLMFEFVRMVLNVLGILAAVSGVQVVMRLHAEEAAGRVDALLAGALPRRRLFLAYVALALLAPAAALLLGGAGLAAVATSMAVEVDGWAILRQAVLTVPAVWVLIGVAIALVGARPSLRFAGWLAVVATFALTFLGPMFRLPDRVLAISPLWHVPGAVGTGQAWLALLWLGLVVAAFVAVGFVGFGRRDVAGA